MKRQTSRTAKPQSRQKKQYSKAKRPKHHYITPQERRTENIPMNTLQEHQLKNYSSSTFPQSTAKVIAQKMRMISHCLEKIMDKKQIDIFGALGKEIQKQFTFRARIQSLERTANSSRDIKQQREFLNRTIEKEQELSKMLTNALMQASSSMFNGSGVLIRDSELIAREMSPKNLLSGMISFEKKTSGQASPRLRMNVENLKDQIERKNQVIRRLFERIERLGGGPVCPLFSENSKNNKDDKKSTISTFAEQLEIINRKINSESEKSNTFNEIIEEKDQYIQQLLDQTQHLQKKCELVRVLQKENNALKKDESAFHSLKKQIAALKQQTSKLQETIKAQKKQFQCLVTQKLNCEKQLKQDSKILEQKKNLLCSIQGKLLQLGRQDLPQLKNLFAYDKANICKELNTFKDYFVLEIQTIAQKMNEQCQNCRKLQKQKQQLQLLVQSSTEMRKELQMKLNSEQEKGANKKRNLKIESWIFSLTVEEFEDYHDPHYFEMTTFDIHKSHCWAKDSIDAQSQTQKYKPLSLQALQFLTIYQKPVQQTVPSEQLTEQILCIQVASQTTSLNSISIATQTIEKELTENVCQTIQTHLSTHSEVVKELFVSERKVLAAQTQTCYSELMIEKVMQITFEAKSTQIVSTSTQTDQVEQQQKDQSFLRLPIQINGVQHVYEPSESQQDISPEILEMLELADTCVLGSEIGILRQQIIGYKEEVDKLKGKLRQLESEKERSNEFDFNF